KTKERCTLVERFLPAGETIRWEIEIRGAGEPWTTKIQSGLRWPVTVKSRFWAPWSDPRLGRKETSPAGTPVHEQLSTPELAFNWGDPLIPHTFVNDTFWYGAPYFRYEEPHVIYIPFQWDLFSIPMVSAIQPDSDTGLSLVLNPNDEILDLTLTTSDDGTLIFNRIYNRISAARPLHFSMNLVAHEADWRGGLRWMSRQYPDYFNPVIAKADDMAGTSAYSNFDTHFDIAKMKKMAFTTNWQASFDFPYMGMFIPPVGENVKWIRFGGDTTSIAAMREYARTMKEMGFYVLNYFNVTEFGTRMERPVPPRKTSDDKEIWKDPNDFFYYKLPESWLPVPDRVLKDSVFFHRETLPGGTHLTWEGGIVTDPGEPVYKEFLLDQARKHVKYLPEASGIAIDRMDWLRMYNETRDDGITWFVDRPARSLITSWKDLMKELAPIMHDAGKTIFVNNHVKRIDLLKNTDGIFDEFTYAGAPLNTTALMCINKPALGWTSDSSNIHKEGSDAFFQKYLYMGVYPMAPFPGNDHSILPDDWTDRQYLDYGPLMAAMRGKKWVLEPHCLEVKDGAAKANLFEVPGGYVVPVVFGTSGSTVSLRIRNIPGLSAVRCEALYPGIDSPFVMESSFTLGILEIKVPLIRGCAMVKIRYLPVDAPKPYGPLPSAAQLKWHQSELYGLVHFSTTTYANLEWGYGNEPAADFNPKEFNADQIAAAAKAGGLKGLILVAKHHCGFCLWPSKYNDSYSVKNSPWREGKGDMVKEYADACHKYGLNFGVYLSPWDRNHKDYGHPEYITYYLNQLRELLTNYGPICEVWLDGANGGDGWYGGAKEKRTIDKNSYYPFDKIFALVRQLQPNAVIFSDIGPDARWVGNESGMAGATCWATFTPKNRDDERLPATPGNTKYQEGEAGHRDGKYWIPAESDFPLRNGWFYHPKEHPRSPENLWKVYVESVGRGASMNIGLAPDTRGLICDEDVTALEGFGKILTGTFRTNLAAKAKITAGNTRSQHSSFGTANLTDNKTDTYWATDDAVTNCGIVFDFPEPVTFDIVRFREYLPLGQRVEGWQIDTWTGSSWKLLSKGASIGSCRIIQSEPVTTTRVRFRITKSPVCQAISEFGLYLKSSGIDPDQQAKEEIMTSMRQSQDYWNASNLDGFMHNYWLSDSLKFIGKTDITYGWDATLKRYKASFPDKAKQGTLKFVFIHLEKISGDAWFQVGKYTLVREKETLSGHFTLQWKKINGQWRIVADHSS
ncbi:MAG: alpha-L-fucosidase, partial [Bacteroidales bacterium]